MLYSRAGGFAFTCQPARIVSFTLAVAVPPAATVTGATTTCIRVSGVGVLPPPSWACATATRNRSVAATTDTNRLRLVMGILSNLTPPATPPSRQARERAAGTRSPGRHRPWLGRRAPASSPRTAPTGPEHRACRRSPPPGRCSGPVGAVRGEDAGARRPGHGLCLPGLRVPAARSRACRDGGVAGGVRLE